MQIVQVRRKPQSLYRPFNVRLDMRRGIRHSSITEDVKAAFGGNYHHQYHLSAFLVLSRTEYFISEIMCPDKIA
jgi:hypothetical protein